MPDTDLTNGHENDSSVEIVCFSLDLDTGERERLYPYLSDDEKERAGRYRFETHRHRFICNRGRLREILAQNGNCRPEDIHFELSRYGKPSIGEPGGLSHIHFNASASGPVAAVAISNSTSLGFDLEQVDYGKERDFDLIVSKGFTREELDWYLQHCDSGDRVRAFYSLWTCKEAYLKALGVGLSKALDKFSVNMKNGQPHISRTELEDSDHSGLVLHQLHLAKDVVACLALPGNAHNIKVIYIL